MKKYIFEIQIPERHILFFLSNSTTQIFDKVFFADDLRTWHFVKIVEHSEKHAKAVIDNFNDELEKISGNIHFIGYTFIQL